MQNFAACGPRAVTGQGGINSIQVAFHSQSMQHLPRLAGKKFASFGLNIPISRILSIK